MKPLFTLQIRRRLRELQGRLRASGFAREAAELSELLGMMADEVEHSARRSRYLLERTAWLEERLTRVEESAVFKALRSAGGVSQGLRRRLENALNRGAQADVKASPPSRRQNPYSEWIERREEARPSWEAHRDSAERWSCQPLVSVIFRFEVIDRPGLSEALAMLERQSYPHWELFACVAGDRPPWLEDEVHAAAGRDPRVHPEAFSGSIPAACNQAVQASGGEYLALAGDGGMLSPHALFAAVETLQQEAWDVCYADEEITGGDGQPAPLFKPDWSPELLLGCAYWGPFFLVSRAAFNRAGGILADEDGSYLHDLALRLTDGSSRVRHIPEVLYRRRSGFSGPRGIGPKAIEDALRRRGIAGLVEPGPRPGTYLAGRHAESAPLATLIVCSAKPELLNSCLERVEARTDYQNRQWVIVEHWQGDNPPLLNPAGLKAVLVPYEGPFDFARMNNQGAAAASGEVLVFLNDDTEPLRPDWLRRLVAQAIRPEVGAVGALLLYPSGLIQHAGIALGMRDGAGHPGRGITESKLWPWLNFPRNVSAVTGACLAMRASLFRSLGGFSVAFPVNYNDVDLCLRVREAGFETIFEPRARLRHYEAQTRNALVSSLERLRFLERWDRVVYSPDPFYSPNLSWRAEEISLADS